MSVHSGGGSHSSGRERGGYIHMSSKKLTSGKEVCKEFLESGSLREQWKDWKDPVLAMTKWHITWGEVKKGGPFGRGVRSTLRGD